MNLAPGTANRKYLNAATEIKRLSTAVCRIAGYGYPTGNIDPGSLHVPDIYVEIPTRLRRRVRQVISRWYRHQTALLVFEGSKRIVSLSTTRVRQRLCDLMGTDVIRLNDRRYFEKLSQRLKEEYDTMMDKHEDARAQSEQQRQRRLMLEGVIEAPDDYRALIHGGHKHRARKKTQKQRARSAAAAQYRTASEDAHLTSRDMDDERDPQPHKEEVITQIEILAHTPSRQTSKTKQVTLDVVSPRNTPSGKFRRRPKSSENEIWTTTDDKTQSLKDMLARPPHHCAVRSSSPSSMNQSKRVKSASARLTHWDKESDSDSDDERYSHRREPRKVYKKESPLIRSLRQEETVEGLYSIAAKLISPIKTDDVSRKELHIGEDMN